MKGSVSTDTLEITPKLSGLKITNISCLNNFCGSEIQEQLNWVVLAQFLLLQSNASQHCSQLDLTGTGGSASKMIHLPGCWQEASVPHHLVFSI